jgi:muconolactone D-isomerase
VLNNGLSIKENVMEFLVEFEIRVPQGTPPSEVRTRQEAEPAAAAGLVEGGHLARVWNLRDISAEKVLGLYRAASERELDELLRALPLYEWITVDVTPLEPHPNDPR